MTREPRDARHAERRWLTAWALFVGALLPRLYVAIAWAKEPVWDGHYYDFGARRIAAGLGYSDDVLVGGEARWHPWCHYPVGYSGFLAIAYVVFGAGPKVAVVANAVVGASLTSLTYLLGDRALGHARGLLAGLLVASSPELIAYSALLMTEPLSSLAPVAAALVILSSRSRLVVRALAAGAVAGLGVLVRPQVILCVPLLGLLELDLGRARASWRRAAWTAAIAVGASLLVVAPWTARNCRVMDGCAFVSTNAGWNLAIGSSPRATGRFDTLRATDGCPVVTGQVQQDRCWAGVGARQIREAPLRWLSLVPKKLSHTFDHASFPMGYLGESDPGRFDEATKEKGRRWLGAAHAALLALATAGALGWSSSRRRVSLAAAALALATLGWVFTRGEPRPLWWLAVLAPTLPWLAAPSSRPPLARYVGACVLAMCATHAVFFGEDRYHVFLTPLFALLAACAGARGARAVGASG
ncbi:MAG: glycosyltransferase family 39 protein [Polyangiaceae bacterium]|nr:glycosyltransferase family 39 protein [Polyangiaceae bacterium]